MRADPSIGEDPTVAPVEPRSKELGDLVGSCIAGRYQVGPLIGEGAMGSVFRGRHLGLAKDVAIKVLRPEFTQHRQIAARFEREAKVVSLLSHPGIVQVLDFGPEPESALGRPIVYIVMELLAGQELKAFLGAPLPPNVALRRVVQMLEGIAHAHERGVIHRDLKPENVFVTVEPNGAEQLKLVDFGIAKLLESGGPALTQMGMVFGTPAYMSPEQAIGANADERSDLYAVGIILYEMLAGQPPFVDDDIGVLLRRQIQAEPKRIAGLLPVVQRLLDRLLAKSADERIPSALEAITMVKAAMAEIEAGSGVPRLVPAPEPSSAPRRVSVLPRGTEIALPTVDDAVSAGASASEAAVTRPSTLPPLGSGPISLTRMRSFAVRRPPWLWPAGAAAVALVLVGIIWAARSEDEPAPTPEVAVGSAPTPVERLQDALRTRAPEGDLAAIDALLAAGKWSAAGTKIDALVKEYPDDGQLLWRRGRQQRGKGAGPAARAKVYAAALELEPSLLDDPELQQELARELASSRVADELIAALAEHRLAPQLLLQLALRTKNALPYASRHVVLEAVGRDPEQAKKIDRALHRSLDAWQAGDTNDPCAAYKQALDAMAAKPDAGQLGTLLYAMPPQACADLAAKQAEVRAAHQEQFANAAITLPPDYEGKRPKKKKRRRGFFGIFR